MSCGTRINGFLVNGQGYSLTPHMRIPVNVTDGSDNF